LPSPHSIEKARAAAGRPGAPAAGCLHLGGHLALGQVDHGDGRGRRGVLHQHEAAVAGDADHAAVVERLRALGRQQHLVLEAQGLGVPDLQHVGAVAAAAAAEVGGGDEQRVGLGAQREVAGVAGVDHAQQLAGAGVEHPQPAVDDVEDHHVGHVDALGGGASQRAAAGQRFRRQFGRHRLGRGCLGRGHAGAQRGGQRQVDGGANDGVSPWHRALLLMTSRGPGTGLTWA
jgi:hypothetical protein